MTREKFNLFPSLPENNAPFKVIYVIMNTNKLIDCIRKTVIQV